MHAPSFSFDDQYRLTLRCPGWDGFALAGLAPVLRLGGERLAPTEARAAGAEIAYRFGARAEVTLAVAPAHGGLRVRAWLRNIGSDALVLGHVALLETAEAAFGRRPERVRLLAQTAYGGDVAPLRGPRAEAVAADEPGGETPPADFRWSQNVWLAADAGAGQALLAGFLTGERWCGAIELDVAPDGRVTRWTLGFDGGDLPVAPGEEIALEEALLLAGPDPHALLEAYGDVVAARHAVALPPAPPLSWCSWYPYRLGVTEERLLENARIGAARLGAFGFRVVEADLGWEQDYLPSAFTENDQFPHGLGWLAGELGKLGLELGVWKAPFTISAFDPLARAHPEWLVAGEDGRPFAYWTWYWKPHGDVYILDLTHPGAQGWLRERIDSLRARGVRYLKSDFIGCAGSPAAKRRHDPRIVAGGGCEAARIGARIIREALPDAWLLNCGGPELPGAGQWPLLYACQDTGNTGIITWDFHRMNYRGLATHLWKNGRWGWIQPSCLCVGLPGTLEEARLRATAAFLAGGQIDLSDTLSTLPEDRWQVLFATLPPLHRAARAIDLYAPLAEGDTLPPGSVWHLPVAGDWDAWHLVAVFAFDAAPADQPPAPCRAAIPLARLGLPEGRYWAYEFWSGQFLGELPGGRANPRGYTHTGDQQDLLTGETPGVLELAFAGPGVKLLCLRAARPHPWAVGTTFHQSGGAELSGVRWDAETRTLSGALRRPAGETGVLLIAGGHCPHAEVDGRPVPAHPAPHNAWRVPILTTGERTEWRVVFGEA